MKKIGFIITLALFAIIYSCDKYEEVKKGDDLTPVMQQWAFMGEVTSAGCGTCGSSGYNNFNLMKKNYSGKIVALAIHCNPSDDSMVNYNIYSSYCSSRPTGGGIPSFHIGDKKTPTAGMQPYIDTLLKHSPEAQVKFTASIVGNKMNVTSKVKFFRNVTGEYNVTFFLCENGIDGGTNAVDGYKQSSGAADYKHNNVVRAANTTNAYGDKITTASSTPANTIFDYTCSIDINPRWKKENIYVTAVIWKKNPDNAAECKYIFVNGWDTQVYK